jgi:hypothetical protein
MFVFPDTLCVELLELILDYVPSKSDLKALCATSRLMHMRVIPRLYRNLDLHHWQEDMGNLKALLRGISKGTDCHLRHTQHISFTDAKLPPEPESQHIGRLSFDVSRSDRIHTAEVHSRKSVEPFVVEVMWMIPRDNVAVNAMKRKIMWSTSAKIK